jgi:hypothetical protein
LRARRLGPKPAVTLLTANLSSSAQTMPIQCARELHKGWPQAVYGNVCWIQLMATPYLTRRNPQPQSSAIMARRAALISMHRNLHQRHLQANIGVGELDWMNSGLDSKPSPLAPTPEPSSLVPLGAGILTIMALYKERSCTDPTILTRSRRRWVLMPHFQEALRLTRFKHLQLRIGFWSKELHPQL